MLHRPGYGAGAAPGTQQRAVLPGLVRQMGPGLAYH
jgi:hypothetical protein